MLNVHCKFILSKQNELAKPVLNKFFNEPFENHQNV